MKLSAARRVSYALVAVFCLHAVFSPLAFGKTFASEYELLRQMPPTAGSLVMDKSEPDDQGFVGFHHRDGKWYEAGMQRGGCRMLISAVVAGDEKRADIES